MATIGLEGLSKAQVLDELDKGARFVYYQYCVSVIIMTFKRSSDVYFIRGGESTFTRNLGFSLISLVFGWWGIPWGPIHTIGSLAHNLGGGSNITKAVRTQLTGENEDFVTPPQA